MPNSLLASSHSWRLWPLLALGTLCNAGPAISAPLDALRTLWTANNEPWSNPAHIAWTRTAQTELDFNHHLLIRSQSRESATWGMSGRQDMPLSRGTLRLEFRRAGTKARISLDPARLSSKPHKREHLDLSYGLSFKGRLDLGFKARLRPTTPGVEGAAGLRLELPATWNTAAYLGRYAVDHLISFDFESDRLDADISGYHSAGGLTLWGRVFHKVAVDLRGHWGYLSPDSRKEGYTLAPRASWGAYEGAVTTPIAPAFSLRSRLRYRRLSDRPEGHLQDRRFMRSRATARDVAGFLSMRYAPQLDRVVEWGLFANRGAMHVAQGRLESWPFINSFASVVGGKDWSFWGDVDVRLYGADFNLRRRNARWRLETATRLFHLRGDLSTTSRERRKFNLGSVLFPEEHRTEDIFRTTVVDLDIRIEYRLSAWSLRYAVSQIIPLRVRSTSTVESVEDRRGGRQQQLSLTYTPDLK